MRLIKRARPFLVVAVAVFGQAVHGDQPPQKSHLLYGKDTYVYKTVDGHQIKADVYRSSDKGLRPAIIYIHGGALIFGSRDLVLPYKQFNQYIGAGYTIVSIDYRLAPETKLSAIFEDVRDAYDWVRSNSTLLKVDPERIALLGKSAGGYLALAAGFRLKPKPKAIISFYGYGDITGSWYSEPSAYYKESPQISRKDAFEGVGKEVISGSKWPNPAREKFYIYCRQEGTWPKEVSGHDPLMQRDWFYQYEPIHNITPDYPPTILLHGEKDNDVPFEQSVLLASALKSKGVKHELIVKPKWGHAFDMLDGPDVDDAVTQILGFLKSTVN